MSTQLNPYTEYYGIPDQIEFDSEFFGPQHKGERLIGRVLSIFRDGDGDQWCAFETADMMGVFTIHLGPTFFHRFTCGA